MERLSATRLMARIPLFNTLVKMVVKQFWIKLTKVPRQLTGPRMAFEKTINAYFFLRSASQQNLYVVRQSRQVLEDLALQGISKVSVYGTGEIAEILCRLTSEVPIKIQAVYDDFGNKKFFGFNVLPIEAGAKNEEKIIIAAVAGVDDKIARLMKVGVERERIAILQ